MGRSCKDQYISYELSGTRLGHSCKDQYIISYELSGTRLGSSCKGQYIICYELSGTRLGRSCKGQYISHELPETYRLLLHDFKITTSGQNKFSRAKQ